MKMNIDEARKNIICTWVNAEYYKDVLEVTPHRRFGVDTVIMCRFIQREEDGSYTTAVINNDLMRELEFWSEDSLFEEARRNTRCLMEENIFSLGEGVYVVTNQQMFLGAGTVFYTEKLRTLADNAEADLYIIPSSVHEALVVPTYTTSLNFLRKTVRDINGTIVTGNEVLSNDVYIYKRASGVIEVA